MSRNPIDSDVNTGEIWTVGALNRAVRGLLEQGLPALAVAGEISNLARPQSGHIYFSLKDDHAQIRCAFFRQRQQRLTFRPENGDEAIVFGKVSLYEPRGDYQLIVEHVESSGEGALQRRFEALKAKLSDEGLFDDAAKRPLPVLPRRIGLITSPSGAAIRDILNILARRFPAVPVRIYPVAVQGTNAPGEIVAALASANTRSDCDVLILARGGGSLEDLWAFNEERVARAMAACSIPIIAGVGHETDTTIADFVADMRAPTPSGAAEIAVPVQREWIARVSLLKNRQSRAIEQFIERYQQRLDWHARQLAARSPAAQLELRRRRLREAMLRLTTAQRAVAIRDEANLRRLEQRLHRRTPLSAVGIRIRRLQTLEGRLANSTAARLSSLKLRVALAARSLDAVSPLSTLARGFAIVSDSRSGGVIHSADDALRGRSIDVRLHSGSLEATVDSVKREPDA